MLNKGFSYSVVVLFFLAAFLQFTNCSKTPAEKFDIALKKISEGDVQAVKQIEGLLLEAASPQTFSSGEIYCDTEILWEKNGGSIDIVYPKKGSFKMQNGGMNSMRAIDDNNAVFSDGADIFIFAWDGKLKKRIKAGAKNESILALAVSKGSVYYLKNSKIYSISENNDEKLFIKESFIPPYSKLFNSYMYTKGNTLGVLLGVAGSYHFSAIDIEKQKVIATNIRMASSRLYLREDSVLYMSGNTGDWALSRFTFGTKTRKDYQRYREIEDVEIFQNEIITKNSSGIRIGSAGKKDYAMPNEYQFKGACGPLALIKYGNAFYGVDPEKLYELIVKTNLAQQEAEKSANPAQSGKK